MRVLLSGLIGATLTSLLLVGPAIHAGAWLGAPLSSVEWGLVASPMIALVVALTRRSPWTTLWLYPCAHLPALVACPQLTGASLYGGADGLLALGALLAAGAAWYLVQLWPTEGVPARWSSASVADAEGPPDRSAARPTAGGAARSVAVAAGVFTSGVYAVFVHAAFVGEETRAEAANVTLAVGACVAWYVVGRLVVTRLGDVVLNLAARRRYRSVTLAAPMPSARRAMVAASLAALGAVAIALWHASGAIE